MSALGHESIARLGLKSAGDIMRTEFRPLGYVVPGLLAEGVTLFAGKPKLGKSWLVLDLALVVAGGGKALGGVPVEQGDVLYLALEDNLRRLKFRLEKLCPSSEVPERLFIDTECPSLDKGGIEAIQDWVDGANNPRLIILDVLGRVKPESNSNATIYENDYQALQALKDIADKKGLAVIVVHHTRKMGADDLFDTVSGSTGLTGAADTVLVLARNGQGTILYGRGRDIDEVEMAMSFDRETCRWSALGKASEVHRSDERSAILDALRGAERLLSPSEISTQLGLSGSNNVSQLLLKMLRNGEVVKVKRGRYRHPERLDLEADDILDSDDDEYTNP